jgi:hypothetical protein
MTQPGTVAIAVPAELAPAVERMIAQHRAGGTGPAVERLEYHTPQPARRRPLADWPLMGALLGLCAVVHILAASLIPKYETVYRDFGTKLPTVTAGFVWLSRFVVSDLGWIYIWPVAIVIPILVAQFRSPPADRRRGIGLPTALVLVLIAALLLWSHYALVDPLLRIILRVSSGAGGGTP